MVVPLTSGARLGPYEVLEPLGSGGMGEVYRARDPRLGRDVAIKVVLAAGEPDPDRLRRFEDEAHAVAALSHPNVLTVHDVGSHEGRPFLVLELLEGETLRARLERGALPLRRAVGVAVEVCHGLDAAHSSGLVHRDLKPENIFLTSDGRVKILDFGLAKLTRGDVEAGLLGSARAGEKDTKTAPGIILGTLGYLSPEQARGLGADARSDLFALGAVLYEMPSGRRAFQGKTPADTLSAILSQDPPAVASTSGPLPLALDRVVRRCLAKDPVERFHSAHDLGLALETVLDTSPLWAAGGIEERAPYPGLSSFTEADAARFFGRESEVEALWDRLKARKLLAVIGPSGAGKSSFVRAGVVASRPLSWGAIACTPGTHPLRGLGQALAPELASDPDALRRLPSFDDPETAFELLVGWRSRCSKALVVVDQLEELFTQNGPEMQATFAALLGRLVEDGDVHVLLSLRDDFLMRCDEHEALGSIFDALTPLRALSGRPLRRALEEPARAEGFSFEDGLLEKMIEAVEGERGALPLLAFAVAQLWERRDRETKKLTREAYSQIEGVAGALARHAEATLERIGVERQGIVREIFRNLVTSHGTRAACQREELLSIFPDRKAAEEVLDLLVDARLLNSYELAPEDAAETMEREAATRHRIEIVHESLLKSWLRLVRWQAQDADGALLRDQLKQAAHLWDEKGRPADLLWTGTSYGEFAIWRERYAGRLTALEEEFAQAMVHRARRRKHLRRTVVAWTFVGLLAILTIIGGLWQRSVAEARRAEASKLLALGRLDMEAHPTAALAYARSSLGLADTAEARRFALEVLWRGPVARILPVTQASKMLDLGLISQLVPSPDGQWLALRSQKNRILLFPRDGGPVRALPRPPDGSVRVLGFGPRSDLIITGGSGESLCFWSLPDLREIRSVELGGVESEGRVRAGRLLTLTRMSREDLHRVVRVWPLPDGEPGVLGTLEDAPWDVDSTGTWLAYSRERSLRVRPLDASWSAAEQVLGSSRDEVSKLAFAPISDRLASIDSSDEIRLWSLAADAGTPMRTLQGPDRSGHRLAPFLFGGDGAALVAGTADGALHVWDLEGPPDARPTVLRRPGEFNLAPAASDPRGKWLAASNGRDIAFWPIPSLRVRTFDGRTTGYHLPFSADGRWLISCGVGDAALRWPLRPRDGHVRDLTKGCFSIATHPTGPHLLVGKEDLLLVPIEGGTSQVLLDGWEGGAAVHPVAFDLQGRRAFAGPLKWGGLKDPRERVLRIWDLESGEDSEVSFADITDASWVAFGHVAFAPDGSLLASGRGGVHRLILPDEPGGALSSETVYDQTWAGFDLTRDGRYLLVWGSFEGQPENGCEELLLLDLQEHTSRRITTHGGRVRTAALAASGRIIVTADVDGVVRAGPVTGEEAHLLLGQEGAATALGVSPDLRWVASWSNEEISLWPMLDVTKAPFHILPYDELMAKLRAHTNLQVVEDKASSTGYSLEIGPFPGWKDVPTW